MNRPLSVAVTLSMLIVISAVSTIAAAVSAKQPNVILVLTDDLGYSDIGCYGAKNVETPHIDRLAAEGMKFTDFHTAASICSPSRAAFLTGAYPQRAGLYMGINPIRKPHWFLGLNPTEVTLAEQFKQKKYDTYMVGKWHLGTEPEFHPLKQGFDHYYGMPCNFSHSPKFFDGEKEVFGRTPLERLTDLYTKKITKIIREQADEPFFLYYAHNYPHTPFKAGKRFAGTSKDGVRGDVIQELDWSIGQMMQALKDKGIVRNTIVIFTSDNGPTRNEYARPYRGTKYVTFEGGHRVPFIIHWPAMIRQRAVSSTPILAMDVFPTLSQVIGQPLPKGRIYDGESLVPLIHGEPLKRAVNQPFFYYNCENLQAVRFGDWKLHLPRTSQQLPFWDKNKAFTKLTKPVLYNLREDRAEEHDVAAENPQIVKQIQEIASNARRELGEYLQRGSGQRPTGSVFEDAPIVGTERDWGKIDAATRQRIHKERVRRHGPVKPKKRAKNK